MNTLRRTHLPLRSLRPLRVRLALPRALPFRLGLVFRLDGEEAVEAPLLLRIEELCELLRALAHALLAGGDRGLARMRYSHGKVEGWEARE